jgi:hypothetical protein
MNNKIQFYNKGYGDQEWGYPILDWVWDDPKNTEYPKKYQRYYRAGQIYCYKSGESFKNEKPWFMIEKNSKTFFKN